MLQHNIEPDLLTTNLLIKLHIPYNDFLGAMSIVELQSNQGITPSAETFSSLIEVASQSTPHVCMIFYLSIFYLSIFLF